MADVPLFWDEDGDCTAEVVGYMNEMAAKEQRKAKKKKSKSKPQANKKTTK